jgi:poly(hydroxyalkanoate) depolymerase family esterase
MNMRISVLLAALVATTSAASAGTLEQVTGFGSNPGALTMWRYRPTTPAANAPLVLFLHGCSQTHTDAAAVGWTQLADQYGFYVVFPEQGTANNPIRCFNWAGEYGDPANLVRGQGENLSLKQMVDKMRADHDIDPSRVYVAGFSAGGAFASVMLATWPDVFAAGAVMAGIPYRCATTVNGAYNCQALASHAELKKTPTEWGDLVRNAHPGYTGPRPKVIIFHGSSDAIVSPDNQIELVEQWTNVLGADQSADEMTTIAGHERARHKAGGATVVESWRVASMGHAVSMGADPEHACPPSGGTYIENRGMCAAWRAAVFFGLTGGVEPPQDGGGMPDGGMPPDGGTGPDGGSSGGPAVTITAPGDGDEVSGAVTISAEASAGDGVARVEFKVDGVLKGSDGTAPYTYRWQTANVSAGSHAIEAVVYDRWEVSASDGIDVMVGEGGGGGVDPTLVDPIPCGCSGGGASAVGIGVVVLLFVGFMRRRSAA